MLCNIMTSHRKAFSVSHVNHMIWSKILQVLQVWPFIWKSNCDGVTTELRWCPVGSWRSHFLSRRQSAKIAANHTYTIPYLSIPYPIPYYAIPNHTYAIPYNTFSKLNRTYATPYCLQCFSFVTFQSTACMGFLYYTAYISLMTDAHCEIKHWWTLVVKPKTLFFGVFQPLMVQSNGMQCRASDFP